MVKRGHPIRQIRILYLYSFLLFLQPLRHFVPPPLYFCVVKTQRRSVGVTSSFICCFHFSFFPVSRSLTGCHKTARKRLLFNPLPLYSLTETQGERRVTSIISTEGLFKISSRRHAPRLSPIFCCVKTLRHAEGNGRGLCYKRLSFPAQESPCGSPISLKDVAKRQDISDKYLEQIISILNKAGYVRSVRGAQGGYMLKMEPQNYTVGMILRQTEGSLAPVACIEDDEIVCDRQQQCVTSIVYKKINDAISGVVDNITLQDLVDWQNEKNGNYVI